MRFWQFGAVGASVALGLVVTMTSCSPQQLADVDQAFADACDVGRTIADLPESPAGPLIPAEIRIILELIGLGGAGLYAIWQKIRASKILERSEDLEDTAKAIVDGIEASDQDTQTNVKAQIKGQMEYRRVYDTADAIVDELKAQRT